jgi:hypothetical protein
LFLVLISAHATQDPRGTTPSVYFRPNNIGCHWVLPANPSGQPLSLSRPIPLLGTVSVRRKERAFSGGRKEFGEFGLDGFLGYIDRS